MKTLLPALILAVLAAVPGLAQQVTSPVLLVYVQKPKDPPIIARIALGLAQPTLKITAFEKCARITNAEGDGNMTGIALQLNFEDAKAINAVLDDKSMDDSSVPGVGEVWFASPDHKVLGHMPRGLIKNQIANDGVLAVFLGGENALYTYLYNTLNPK